MANAITFTGGHKPTVPLLMLLAAFTETASITATKPLRADNKPTFEIYQYVVAGKILGTDGGAVSPAQFIQFDNVHTDKIISEFALLMAREHAYRPQDVLAGVATPPSLPYFKPRAVVNEETPGVEQQQESEELSMIERSIQARDKMETQGAIVGIVGAVLLLFVATFHFLPFEAIGPGAILFLSLSAFMVIRKATRRKS